MRPGICRGHDGSDILAAAAQIALPFSAFRLPRLAREADLAPNTRLSCQIRVESDLEVRVINRSHIAGVPAGARPLD